VFAGTAELVAQMRADIDQTRRLLHVETSPPAPTTR
jgi:hypothetical protein